MKLHLTEPTPALVIRNATLADLDALAMIEAACFPAAEAASKESFAKRLAVFPDHFWLIEQGGEVVAFLNGAVLDDTVIDDSCYENANCHNPDGAYQALFGINTLPAYRKQELGRKMLNALIDTARREGRTACILACKDALKPYYESFGYVCMGRSASTHGGAAWNDMILML